MAIIDHHPAVRRGLQVGLDSQAAMEVVGTAADRTELWRVLESSRADVLVLGQPAREHAAELCWAVHTRHAGCRVVLYSTPAVAVSAVLAGAHAVVDRSEDLGTLVDAVWIAAGGGRMLPELTPTLRRQAAMRLAPTEQAILAMLLAETPVHDIAAVTGLSRRQLEGRRAAILAALAGRRVPGEAAPSLAA